MKRLMAVVLNIIILLLSFIIYRNLEAQNLSEDKIIFASDRDTALYPNLSLFTMDIDGSNITQLVDSLIGYMPRVSRDGKRIAYIGRYSDEYLGPPQIRVMDFDGSDNHVVSLWEIDPGIYEPVLTYCFHPVWSPDGVYVAYDRCDNCELGGGNFEIHIVKSDTVGGFYESIVTNSPYAEFILDWSPNGERLLFRAHYFNKSYDFDGEMFTMNVDGTDWRQLTNDGRSVATASYSPTGDSIAYIADSSGQKNIYIMNTTNLVVEAISIPELGFHVYSISWSHNGKKLVFDSDNQIYILDIESKTVSQITSDNFHNITPEFFTTSITGIPEEQFQNVHNKFSIKVYPNPSNLLANVNYILPKDSHVKLILYNLLGQRISVLLNQYQRAGELTFQCDLTELTSGIYFFVITLDSVETFTQKIILMK